MVSTGVTDFLHIINVKILNNVIIMKILCSFAFHGATDRNDF